jgi:hypothetical protein
VLTGPKEDAVPPLPVPLAPALPNLPAPPAPTTIGYGETETGNVDCLNGAGIFG